MIAKLAHKEPRTEERVFLNRGAPLLWNQYEWPPSTRRVYLDLGAYSPKSSIREFARSYPGFKQFEVHAWEPDPRWDALYADAPNVHRHKEAVSTKADRAAFLYRGYIGKLETLSRHGANQPNATIVKEPINGSTVTLSCHYFWRQIIGSPA